jgi:5-(carboxyamino)imidazole ribonucleotide mutase
VLGVPLEASQGLGGMDALMAIVQMPPGIPVGTLAIGKPGAINAAMLATAILALSDEKIAAALEDFRAKQTQTIADMPPPDAE